MERKERVAIQRATIVNLRAKDPSLTTSVIAIRLGLTVSTVARILREEMTGLRRRRDGVRVPLKRESEKNKCTTEVTQ